MPFAACLLHSVSAPAPSRHLQLLAKASEIHTSCWLALQDLQLSADTLPSLAAAAAVSWQTVFWCHGKKRGGASRPC